MGTIKATQFNELHLMTKNGDKEWRQNLGHIGTEALIKHACGYLDWGI